MFRKIFLILSALCIAASAHAYIVRVSDSPLDLIFKDDEISAFKCRYGDRDLALFFSTKNRDEGKWEMSVYNKSNDKKWTSPMNLTAEISPEGKFYNKPNSDAVDLGKCVYAVKINDEIHFVKFTTHFDENASIRYEFTFFRIGKNSPSGDAFTMSIDGNSANAREFNTFILQFIPVKMKEIEIETLKISNLVQLHEREKNMPVYDFSDTPKIVPDPNNKYWRQFFEAGKMADMVSW